MEIKYLFGIYAKIFIVINYVISEEKHDYYRSLCGNIIIDLCVEIFLFIKISKVIH